MACPWKMDSSEISHCILTEWWQNIVPYFSQFEVSSHDIKIT